MPTESPPAVLIANSGATDYMWPEYSVFTLYCPLQSKHVTLANIKLALVYGLGSIKILFDGKVVGLRNVLHILSLCLPLYSLKTH